MNTDSMDPGILGPAFLAGLLVLSTHVPLGRQVLARGIIFIDLAIAQIAGLGVIAARGLDWEPGGWQMQLAAGGAALSGAVLLHWTEKRWPQTQEALIGSVFVLAATGGILLLAANPHGGEHLRDLLAGQILWVSYSQLLPLALLSALILTAWSLLSVTGSSLWFYVLFSLAVTASVQLIGVYLVFASLIIPALAVRGLHTRSAMGTGYLIGAAGYATGLALSALLDLPSGAMIVWALACCALLAGSVLSARDRRR